MSGYSQGAQLVHNAASELPASTMDKVSAVVTFGDPGMRSPFSLSRFPSPKKEHYLLGWPLTQKLQPHPVTDSSSAVANMDASKVLVICHDGDGICQFGDIITLEHLTYAENVTAAASFVVSAAGL